MKKKIIKFIRFIHSLITLPFLYKVIKQNKTNVFLFFPSWEMGGAERVHIHILDSIKDLKPTCFITFKPNNDGFKNDFQKKSYVVQLGFWGGILRKLSLPIIASHINSLKKPVVFGSNNTYYYDLIPYLKSHVKVIDLKHAISSNHSKNIKETIEYYSKNTIHRINKRIVLGEVGKQENIQFYQNIGINVPENKFICIPNAIDIPPMISEFSYRKRQILFVGRYDWIKRANIFINIAKKMKENKNGGGGRYKFICIGNFPKEYIKSHPEVTFTGPIYEFDKLEKYYQESRYIILCSISEGLPMVILEAMANGVIPITVDVGELNYLINKNNGIIIPNSKDSSLIADKLYQQLKLLENTNANYLNKMSINARNTCIEKHSRINFINSYRNLFIS